MEYGTGIVPKCTILLSCVGGARWREGGREAWLPVGEQESGKARGWVNTEL